MKKFILGLVATAFLGGVAVAQPNVELIKKAKKAVSSIDGKPEKTQAAEEAVKAMMDAPENANNAAALVVKAKLYTALIDVDDKARTEEQVKAQLAGGASTYKSKSVDAPKMALAALKAADTNNQDKKVAKEIAEEASKLPKAANAIGDEFTRENDYANAFGAYSVALDAHYFLKSKGAKSQFDKEEDLNNQIFRVGILGFYGKKEVEAASVFEKLIEIKRDTNWTYVGLFNAYATTDETKAANFLEMGRKKFPGDVTLLFTQINYFLKKGKLDVLITNLKEGIDKEPSNASLHLTLGNVYDQLSQKETDEAKMKEYVGLAMASYNKTLELDPKSVEALYSVGAIYYNAAAAFSKQMKALESDFSKAGQAKYDTAEKAMMAEFEKALPYFEKAESNNPNDQNTLIALKEIYARKGLTKVANELKARLENVPNNKESYFKK